MWFTLFIPSPSPSLSPLYFRLVFAVVADPEDQEADCEEVGTAELDLHKVTQIHSMHAYKFELQIIIVI